MTGSVVRFDQASLSCGLVVTAVLLFHSGLTDWEKEAAVSRRACSRLNSLSSPPGVVDLASLEVTAAEEEEEEEEEERKGKEQG